MSFGRCVHAALVFGLGATNNACLVGDVATHHRTITATVALERERMIAIDSPVNLGVSGTALGTHMFVTLDVVVTASTSTRARIEAEALALKIDHPVSADTIEVKVARPTLAKITGNLSLRAPTPLGVTARSIAPVRIEGMSGAIDVRSDAAIDVKDARADTKLSTSNGTIHLATMLMQGTQTQLESGFGDIVLVLPLRPSVDLVAIVAAQGEIIVQHPAFSPAFSPREYRAQLNGGLATASLLTQTGRIVLTTGN